MDNRITPKGFKEHVDRNAKYDMGDEYCVVALNEEAGEIAGWYKKFVLRGNPTGKLTEQDLLGELGDVLYYLVRLSSLHGWSLEDVMEYNVEKLRKRREMEYAQIV